MEKKIEYSQDLFDETKLNGKGKRFWSRFFFAIFVIYIVLFVLFMSLYLAFKNKYECVPVQGMSMQPTINASVVKNDPNNPDQRADWVYIAKDDLDYGDIVVFNAKTYRGDDDCLIKRVIALEGDAVTIVKKDNPNYEKPVFTVCIIKAESLEDGIIEDKEIIELEEDYITDAYEWTYNSTFTNLPNKLYDLYFEDTFLDNTNYELIADDNGIIYTIVPQGEFFYLGDNRAGSSDSRARGTDLVSSVRGVVQFIVKDAENSSSALLVQAKEVIKYYANVVGDFFSDLWINLEKSFAI